MQCPDVKAYGGGRGSIKGLRLAMRVTEGQLERISWRMGILELEIRKGNVEHFPLSTKSSREFLTLWLD